MPGDYYPGMASTDVFDQLQQMLQQRSAFLVSAGAGGVSASMAVGQMGKLDLNIRRAQWTLHFRGYIDPVTTKVMADPFATRIRKTRARYTYS